VLTLSKFSPTQFTVALRNTDISPLSTAEAVEAALRSVPESRLVRFHSDTGVAVVEVPGHLADHLKEALGRDFIVEPNAPLRY
jgi:hypothetical protein